jgi:hypothetical protein
VSIDDFLPATAIELTKLIGWWTVLAEYATCPLSSGMLQIEISNAEVL